MIRIRTTPPNGSAGYEGRNKSLYRQDSNGLEEEQGTDVPSEWPRSNSSNGLHSTSSDTPGKSPYSFILNKCGTAGGRALPTFFTERSTGGAAPPNQNFSANCSAGVSGPLRSPALLRHGQ